VKNGGIERIKRKAKKDCVLIEIKIITSYTKNLATM
jgi:hypothetical protein